MPAPRIRASATAQRRGQILRAALDCFVTLGYARTTMEDIRERARASTGSIYHHFKSKEQLAAELYLEGIGEAQAVALRAITRHSDAERGTRALVASYLEWVRDNPKFASYLLNMRHAEFMEPIEAALTERNREFYLRIDEWIRAHVASGALPRLEPVLYNAILTGPSESFARQWLAKRTRSELPKAIRRLADAAWTGLWSAAGASVPSPASPRRRSR